MSTNIKLKATADILGGSVFFANDAGFDPEYPNNGDLLPNGMYIRLEGSDNSIAYISAYELDKALGIIGDMSMSKASQADVDALEAALEDKVSSSDFELLQGDVENKASKAALDDALDAFNGKASQEQVDAIIAALNEKASQEYAEQLQAEIEAKADATTVEELSTSVEAKASKATVEELQADVLALQETVRLLTNSDSIVAINNQIAYLNTEIQRRLTIDDLSTINTTVSNLGNSQSELTERVENVEVNLNKKATTTYVQGQVTELNNAITGLSVRVDSKADKSDLSGKANKSDLDQIVKKVNTLGSTVSNLEIATDDNYDELSAALNKKAVKTEVDAAIESLNETIASKADKTTFNEEISRINNNYNNLESTLTEDINRLSGEIEQIECDTNATITELRANINTQNRTITNQGTQLTKLQESSQTYNEKLKQNWVRVLTTNEYKALRTAPEGASYNNRYKYPNTVYLIVDFNKPKAIYIGDILVAKAEQKGSVGFAYTFPIVF